MAERNSTYVAVGEEAQGLRLPLLVSEHEETIKLTCARAVLHATHVGEAHCEALEVLRLEVLNATNKQSTLCAASLKLGVVRPELITHVVALV